jgi:hypothetical protein
VARVSTAAGPTQALLHELPAVGLGEPRRLPWTWIDDSEAIASVVEVWPTADGTSGGLDMMGIPFDGHPNLKHPQDDDWEGHRCARTTDRRRARPLLGDK